MRGAEIRLRPIGGLALILCESLGSKAVLAPAQTCM